MLILIETNISDDCDNVDIDYLPNRKAAIIKIFETVTIKREWQNVLQHMHPNGKKSDLGKNEGDIIRLLNYGKFLNKSVQEILDFVNSRSTKIFRTNSDYSKYLIQYLEMRIKVAPEYPDGIEVVKNTSPQYDIFINRGNVNDYEFYAAKNPEKYDPAGFDEDITSPLGRDGDDSYIV